MMRFNSDGGIFKYRCEPGEPLRDGAKRLAGMIASELVHSPERTVDGVAVRRNPTLVDDDDFAIHFTRHEFEDGRVMLRAQFGHLLPLKERA